jgi:uncharacterized protein YjdB
VLISIFTILLQFITMKKIFPVLGLLLALLSILPVNAQITTYYNNFMGGVGMVPVPGGIPALTFTNNCNNSDPTAACGTYIGGIWGPLVFTNNELTLVVGARTAGPGFNDGHAQTTAPLSGYSAPFNTTLSANLGLVTWTFNMRTTDTGTGLATNQNNAAVIIAATSPAVDAAGSGYAVTFDPSVGNGRGVRLVRYTGGLTGTVTTIISSPSFLTTPIYYASVRVEYDGLTNQWRLYVRDDGAGYAFSDPAAGTLAFAGSAIDATYTSVPMSSFGFYVNYEVFYAPAFPNVDYAYFDNYKVTVTCPPITGGAAVCLGLTSLLSDNAPAGTWSCAPASVATIDPTGLYHGVATGTAIVTYTSGVCVLNRVVTVSPLPEPPAITGVMALCAGQSISLSDAGSGGTWSSSDPAVATVGSTGIVAGIAGGTATVTYSIVPAGCFATAVITVNPLLPIAGITALCEQQSTTLSDAASGGTWVSSNPLVATIGLSTGFLTGVSGATTTITYTTPASCVTSVVVTVNPLPAIATGVLVVCEGLTTTLSTISAGVLWSSGAGAIATVDPAGVVSGLMAGTAMITYKLPTTCMRNVVVTVNPAPLISSATSSVCTGATLALTGTPAGGIWSSTTAGVTANVGSASGIVTGLAVGTSVISYILPTGCLTFMTITVNPATSVITGAMSVCQGLTTTLSSGPSGGAWASSNPLIGSVTSSTGVVTGVSANTVTITYTSSAGAGCFRTAIVTVNPLPSALLGSAIVCEGATTTLSSSPSGGTWSSSVAASGTIGSISGVITGILAGTTVISYTLPTSCLATVVATVIPQPVAFTGSLSVCIGASTTLSTATPGVTWSSANIPVATVISGTGVVSGISNGTAPIIATAVNGCTRTAIVSVNAMSTSITGTSAVCQGATTTLFNATAGGSWSSNNPPVAFIITPSSNVVNGNSPGTAVVSYILPSGCYTTTVVTVNPLPFAISGTFTVCQGLTTTLGSGPTGGTWTSSSGSIAPVTATTGVVLVAHQLALPISPIHWVQAVKEFSR